MRWPDCTTEFYRSPSDDPIIYCTETSRKYEMVQRILWPFCMQPKGHYLPCIHTTNIQQKLTFHASLLIHRPQLNSPSSSFHLNKQPSENYSTIFSSSTLHPFLSNTIWIRTRTRRIEEPQKREEKRREREVEQDSSWVNLQAGGRTEEGNQCDHPLPSPPFISENAGSTPGYYCCPNNAVQRCSDDYRFQLCCRLCADEALAVTTKGRDCQEPHQRAQGLDLDRARRVGTRLPFGLLLLWFIGRRQVMTDWLNLK